MSSSGRTDRTDVAWSDRTDTERKALVAAMEEGYVCELLPESFMITASGRVRDYRAVPRPEAESVLGSLMSDGLIGLYRLNSDEEFLGHAAQEMIASDAIWNDPASVGLCLFLTDDGEKAVGIGRGNSVGQAPDAPPTSI